MTALLSILQQQQQLAVLQLVHWACQLVQRGGEGSGFYPYTWWAQTAPSEKYGGGYI